MPSIPPSPGPLAFQKRLALSLALIAGYVDGYGLLAFNTYLSFMSGNTTQTGANVGRSVFELAVPSSIAIASFLLGLFLGHLRPDEPGATRSPAEARLLGTVGLMLGVASVGIHYQWLGGNGAIAFVALAMGLMNTAFARVGNEPVNLTFVTGTLNKIGAHLAMASRGRPLDGAAGARDTHLARALLLTSIWAAFLGGAVLAGMATAKLGGWTLLPPGAGLGLLAVFAAPGRSRSQMG
ncbi:MAG: YoaK family protein [Phycisphaerales bacterium]